MRFRVVVCLKTMLIISVAYATASHLVWAEQEHEREHYRSWGREVTGINWVAYAPSEGNPREGVEASRHSIHEDLSILRKSGFTGLVTYTVSSSMGRDLADVAESLGFSGIILGIWNPLDPQEMAVAKTLGTRPIVLGFCVGNEGLGKRYSLAQLSAAMKELKGASEKYVTTAEEIDDYGNRNLLSLGDWIFPNAHPYYHGKIDPESAARWTENAYNDLKRQAESFVFLKEVGLPSSGDKEGKLSEEAQEEYYSQLAKSDVNFVYFEAFDQSWKNHLPVEPHWGMFRLDRSAKKIGKALLNSPLGGTKKKALRARKNVFFVFRDADSPRNHYKPTGYMGDCGDIHILEACEESPYSGKTCLRITYDAKGRGPHTCNYTPPCKWAGVYWQHPPNNWGKSAHWKEKGFDLSGYARLVFAARATRECTIEFKIGGIDGTFGDSLSSARRTTAKLNSEWKEYEINLREADLTHIIGGFCWVTNWDTNPNGVTFYLDEIRFAK